MPIFSQAAMTWHRHAPKTSIRDNPTSLLAICVFAASNAFAGRLEPAQTGMAQALDYTPICESPIQEISHHFDALRTSPDLPTVSAKQAFQNNH